MPKKENERYEFSFDELINNGGKENLNGFVFDVCPRGCPPMTNKKMCIILMSEDKSTPKFEEGHRPFGFIEFKDPCNFQMARNALKRLQEAINKEQESKE